MEELRTSPPSILKLIAHKVRWNVLQRLAVGDYPVQDLVQLLHVPQNLISYHMSLLRQVQAVIERPSTVDERSTYYSLDLERLHTLYQLAALDLHPALAKEIDLGPRPPTHVEGTETVRYRAFEQTSLQLTARIRLLLTLLRYQKGYTL